MLNIHREGKPLILVFALALVFSTSIAIWLPHWVFTIISIVFGVVLLFLLYFFRNPHRLPSELSLQHIYSPADGKVVVIEEYFEEEFLIEKRIQVSIFMSPLDVHLNTSPIGGKVLYKRYHSGKYLVAWHPKASRENEHMTVVIENNHVRLLLRQIAGAMAKRIVNYLSVGDEIGQGEEIGFIKFGSRVDLMLPLDAEIKVTLGQHVKAGIDLIAAVDPVQNETTG